MLTRIVNTLLGQPTFKPFRFECDRQIKSLVTELKAGSWSGVQATFKSASPPEREFLAAGIFEHSFSDGLSTFDEWIQKESRNALALAIAGSEYMRRASQARGNGMAETVTDAGWKGWNHWSAKAREVLNRSMQVRPNSIAASQLMWASLSQRITDEQADAIFAAAMSENPENTHLHWAALTRRLQKWGGSHASARAFACSVSHQAKPGSPLHFLVPLLHLEHWLYLDAFQRDPNHLDYWKSPSVRQEIATAFDNSFGHTSFKPNRMSFNPAAPIAVALFVIEDIERLRVMLAHAVRHSNGRPWENPWGYVRNIPMIGFGAAVKAAGGWKAVKASLP